MAGATRWPTNGGDATCLRSRGREAVDALAKDHALTGAATKLLQNPAGPGRIAALLLLHCAGAGNGRRLGDGLGDGDARLQLALELPIAVRERVVLPAQFLQVFFKLADVLVLVRGRRRATRSTCSPRWAGARRASARNQRQRRARPAAATGASCSATRGSCP